ncbi:MAG: DUF6338 family protein [Gammaproteobacteria bacterium]|nr:DUF6338 family protein [Gammaproteobacteria bacterium]
MDTLFNELLDKWKAIIPSSTLILFILAVVPGVIIVFVRSRFVKGNILPYPAGFLTYLTVSIIYWLFLLTLILPMIDLILDYGKISHWFTPINSIKEIICIILIPISIGFVSGWASRKEYVYRILKKLQLNPIHPTPTAWEDCFSDTDVQFVLIKLKNGNQFGGKLDTDCFISSDIENQDIYISQIYEIDEQFQWNKQDRGVFISSGEISSIEFIPIGNEEETNG